MDVEMVIDGGSGNRCGWGMSWGYSISFQSGGAGLKMEGTVPFTNYKNGILLYQVYPAKKYIFKVNNRNTRTRCVSFLLTLNIFHTLF